MGLPLFIKTQPVKMIENSLRSQADSNSNNLIKIAVRASSLRNVCFEEKLDITKRKKKTIVM